MAFLPPLDQRFGTSMPQPGEMSSARQRRRKTTRKTEAESTRINLREREYDGLELSTLENSESLMSEKADFSRSEPHHANSKETIDSSIASVTSDSDRLHGKPWSLRPHPEEQREGLDQFQSLKISKYSMNEYNYTCTPQCTCDIENAATILLQICKIYCSCM